MCTSFRLPIAWNTMLAPALLGEKITLLDYLGTFLILGGTTLVAVGGDKSDTNYSYDDLLSLYNSRFSGVPKYSRTHLA